MRADGIYVDCTFGRGGHSKAILEQLGPDGQLLAIDRDPDAVAAGRELAAADHRLRMEHGRFGELQEILRRCLPGRLVDGIVADLGVSSPQLETARRGFSFQHDGPLDMRMDPGTGESAAAWLNHAEEREIAQVILRLGEEPAARRIARAICERRREKPIETTGELAELVAAVVPRQPGGRHPATRCFQAIRMEVNRELQELDALLEQSVDALRPGGRLCVISFHSLEDRRVKRFMRDAARVDPALARLPVVPAALQPRLRLCGRAVRPGAAELAANPRARSARLRAGERL